MVSCLNGLPQNMNVNMAPNPKRFQQSMTHASPPQRAATETIPYFSALMGPQEKKNGPVVFRALNKRVKHTRLVASQKRQVRTMRAGAELGRWAKGSFRGAQSTERIRVRATGCVGFLNSKHSCGRPTSVNSKHGAGHLHGEQWTPTSTD